MGWKLRHDQVINIAGIWATCETFGLGQKIVKHTQLCDRRGFLSLLSIICIERVASLQGRFNAACHSSQEKRTSVYSVKHGKQKVRHVLKWNDDTARAERPWELVISTLDDVGAGRICWLTVSPQIRRVVVSMYLSSCITYQISPWRWKCCIRAWDERWLIEVWKHEVRSLHGQQVKSQLVIQMTGVWVNISRKSQ